MVINNNLNKKGIILHLLSDEKVVNRTFNEYEECLSEFNHVGLLFSKEEIKYATNNKFHRIENSKSAYRFIHSYLPKVKYVIIHYLTSEKLNLVRLLPKHDINICWFVYGGDLYNRYLVNFGYDLYSQHTRKNSLKNLLKYFIRRLEFGFIVNRVDIFACNACTLTLIQKYSRLKKQLKLVELFAYTIEDVMGSLYKSPFVEGDAIVIGNSASFTNNHNYILDVIKNIPIDSKIVLQLAYGGTFEYVQSVKHKYKALFSNICFNETFCSLENYQRLLNSGDTFIFGNWREEAEGNILTTLYLGKKVYLSKYNPLLEYYRSKGFILFSLENITNDFEVKLSQLQKNKNRTLAEELYNKERLFRLLKETFK